MSKIIAMIARSKNKKFLTCHNKLLQFAFHYIEADVIHCAQMLPVQPYLNIAMLQWTSATSCHTGSTLMLPVTMHTDGHVILLQPQNANTLMKIQTEHLHP